MLAGAIGRDGLDGMGRRSKRPQNAPLTLRESALLRHLDQRRQNDKRASEGYAKTPLAGTWFWKLAEDIALPIVVRVAIVGILMMTPLTPSKDWHPPIQFLFPALNGSLACRTDADAAGEHVAMFIATVAEEAGLAHDGDESPLCGLGREPQAFDWRRAADAGADAVTSLIRTVKLNASVSPKILSRDRLTDIAEWHLDLLRADVRLFTAVGDALSAATKTARSRP